MKRLLSAIMLFVLLIGMSANVHAVDVKQSLSDEYEHEETGITLPYRLIIPEFYDERYIFPLVVFFHGAGERGLDNERQLDQCVQQIADNMPKAIILVPQCDGMSRWVETDWTKGGYSVDEIPESDEMMAVMDLIDEITKTYSVNKNTIYAAGISMGGFAVWDAMVRHNDVFAAGVAVCGAGDPSKAEVLKDTPMFVFHGAQDETVPVSGSTDMVEAIQAAGGTLVQYTEYGDGGHGIWGTVFNQEKLYKELQKCELSDRYSPEESGEQEHPILPWILGGCALALVLILLPLLIVILKKKSKAKKSEC